MAKSSRARIHPISRFHHVEFGYLPTETATVVVETAASQSLSDVLDKVPRYFGDARAFPPGVVVVATDVQAVVVLKALLPPANLPAPRSPAIIALLYRKLTWDNQKRNGLSVAACKCQPDFAMDISPGLNGYFYPIADLQGIADGSGRNLLTRFPLPAPVCNQAGIVAFQMPIALEDLFGVRSRIQHNVPPVYQNVIEIRVDLWEVQQAFVNFYNAATNKFT